MKKEFNQEQASKGATEKDIEPSKHTVFLFFVFFFLVFAVCHTFSPSSSSDLLYTLCIPVEGVFLILYICMCVHFVLYSVVLKLQQQCRKLCLVLGLSYFQNCLIFWQAQKNKKNIINYLMVSNVSVVNRRSKILCYRKFSFCASSHLLRIIMKKIGRRDSKSQKLEKVK